jgi:hypothetical protein
VPKPESWDYRRKKVLEVVTFIRFALWCSTFMFLHLSYIFLWYPFQWFRQPPSKCWMVQ